MRSLVRKEGRGTAPQPSLSRNLQQWPGQIAELPGTEDLNAGVMRAIERRHGGSTARGSGNGRRVEPDAYMVHLHRRRDRIAAGTGREGRWRIH
mgnify:CR=1 FL=1